MEDYRFRKNFALSADASRGLNGNDTVRHTEAFARTKRDENGDKAVGVPDIREDTGIMNGLKLRVAYPTVKTEYWEHLRPLGRKEV